MRLFLITAVLAVCSPVCFAQDLAVVGVRVYTSPDAAPLKDATVLIHGGKISGVGSRLRVPRNTATVSCLGCSVFAGFWNSHIHFTGRQWDDAATQPAAALTIKMQEMLTHSGFTTVVDLGSDIRNTSVLRKRIETGEVAGPRIYTAGSGIYPPNGIPYYLADLPPEIRATLPQPTTAGQTVAIVEQSAAMGADLVKLFTGSYVARGHVKPMPMEVARAAVEAAHARHELVFAHPSNLEGVRVAYDSGVDILAHAPDTVDGVDDALIASLVARHMTMIPTLKLFSGEADIARIRQIVATFHQLGGVLMFGTDTGFLTDYDDSGEYRQLALAGLSFKDVLAMLTTAPAQRFGVTSQEGTIATGKNGDLTILAGDPAAGGLPAFADVRLTIRGGRIIFDKAKAGPSRK